MGVLEMKNGPTGPQGKSVASGLDPETAVEDDIGAMGRVCKANAQETGRGFDQGRAI